MILAAGVLVACAENPSGSAYSQSRIRGCALNRYAGCPESPYVPQEPWPYTYYPLAAIPVYPLVPAYPALPPVNPPPKSKPKPHRQTPVRNRCVKAGTRRLGLGCP